MKKILILLTFCMVGVCTISAENTQDITVSGISKQQVLDKLKAFEKNAIEGKDDKTPLSRYDYANCALLVKSWSEQKYIELDAEISVDWYKKLYILLKYMTDCKRYLERFNFYKTTKTAEYERIKNNFYKAFEKFQQLLKDPTPTPGKRLKELRRQKRREEFLQRQQAKKQRK